MSTSGMVNYQEIRVVEMVEFDLWIRIQILFILIYQIIIYASRIN